MSTAIQAKNATDINEVKRRIDEIRSDFPILERKVNGKCLAYLDNGASTQMPEKVMQVLTDYHSNHHSNVHRGVHTLSQEATDLFEEAREKVRSFISAGSVKEVIFTGGTTDSMNLVMQSWGRQHISKGDTILVSNMEHHANIVPWYMLAKEKGAQIKVIPILDDGSLDMQTLKEMLSSDVKLLAVNHVSNALGTINPIKEITSLCRKYGVVSVIDGAQAVGHFPVDVKELGADFYGFSGHKMHAPTGIGVLYGREELLEKMPPYRGGGDMILSVSFDEITWNKLPYKFEAGTPAIAQVIGLGYAIDYIKAMDRKFLHEYENQLLTYATEKLRTIPGLRIIGTAKEKVAIVSFVIDGVHPHDIGTILDEEAVAVRTGHHCAEPVMSRFNVPATTRASFAFYNTLEEIDALHSALIKVTDLFDVN
jgi:cysteine desulfurase/selenocysteine lyase